MAPDTCPNCGADVPAKAKACPECGACEETGWSDAAATDNLGLPDESFDYDDFVQREFGGKREVRPPGIRPLWWGVALILVLAMLGFVFGRFL